MNFRKNSASVLLGVMALGLSASMMVSATNETEKVKDQTVQVADAEKKDPSADNNLSSDENKGENGQGLLFSNGDNDKKVEGAGASGNGNPDGYMFLGDINAENGGTPGSSGGLSTGAKVGIGASVVGVPSFMAGGYYLYDRLKGSASSEETQQQGRGSSTENQEVSNVDPVMPTEDPKNNPGVLPELTKLVSKSGLDLKTILIVVGSVLVVFAAVVISYFVYRARKSKVAESNLLVDKEKNMNLGEYGTNMNDSEGNNIDNENDINNDIDIINENKEQQEGGQLMTDEQHINACESMWGVSKNCASILVKCINKKDTKGFLQSIGAEFLNEFRKIKSKVAFGQVDKGETIKRFEKISSLILSDCNTPGTVRYILKAKFDVSDFHDFENGNFGGCYTNLIHLGNEVRFFAGHLRDGKNALDYTPVYNSFSFV